MGDVSQHLGFDLEDFLALEVGHGNALLRKQPVLGVVGTEGEGILIDKFGRSHAADHDVTSRIDKPSAPPGLEFAGRVAGRIRSHDPRLERDPGSLHARVGTQALGFGSAPGAAMAWTTDRN